MTLRITTTTEAEAAPENTTCPGHGADYDGVRMCGNPAVWQITTTTKHDQPTPDQEAQADRRERQLAERPRKIRRYTIPKQTQRQYRTIAVYCSGCVPKKHSRRGLKLTQREGDSA